MLEIQKINLDAETQEIISAEVKTVRNVKAERFIQCYLQDNIEFYRLSKAELNILAVCWEKSTYCDDDNIGNKITYNKDLSTTIIEKTGLKEGTIKNTMSSLVKKEMILKSTKFKGIYFLNPKYFFKGQISSRLKLIKKYTEYEIL